MKIGITPFVKENPYQELLATELSRLGCEIADHAETRQLLRLQQTTIDILHLHWLPKVELLPTKAAGLLRFLWRLRKLRRRGIKIVWTVHNITPHESRLRVVDLLVSKVVARLASALICHSEGAKLEVARQYEVPPEKITVIPHGNYIGYYKNEISRDDARRCLSLRPEETVLLFLGQIRPYKGVLELIEAFKKASPTNTRLVIAGQTRGNLTDADLEEATVGAKNISLFLNYIDDSDIQIYMNASDVVAFPYKRSLTSGAILLAMSFGKACLAYDDQTGRSVLPEAGALFVPRGDEVHLVDRLGELPTPEHCKMMGDINISHAKRMDWANIARQTHLLLMKVYSQSLVAVPEDKEVIPQLG